MAEAQAKIVDIDLDSDIIAEALAEVQMSSFVDGWDGSGEVDDVQAERREREAKGKPCGMTWIAKNKRCRINDKINAIKDMANTNPNGKAIPIGIHTTKQAKDRYEQAGADKSDFVRYRIDVEPSTFKHVEERHGNQNIDYGVIPMLVSQPDYIIKQRTRNARGLTFKVHKNVRGVNYEAIVKTSKGKTNSGRVARITITTMYITKNANHL